MLICLQQIMRYLWRCAISVIVHQLILIVSCSQSGCSLRLLNPQAFSAMVWNVLSMLQENFGSMAGANMWVPGVLNFPETFRYGLINVHNIGFVVFFNQISDTTGNSRLCSTLWWYWSICGPAGGEETLESVQPEVRHSEKPFFSVVIFLKIHCQTIFLVFFRVEEEVLPVLSSRK